MNKYLVYMTFLIISFSGIQDGYSQEISAPKAATPKDIIIALDNSGSAKANDPEFLTGMMTRAVLGSLPAGSRVGFITFSDKSNMAIPLTPLTEDGIDKRINEILDNIDHGNGEPADLFWTLDPIDGTKGFLRGDQYAVALALIKEGKPVLGVLGCPNLPFDDKSNNGTLMFSA